MPECRDCTMRIRSGDTTDDSRSLCGPCARVTDGDPSIRVTPLSEDDLELVCAWRSNPNIYRHFRQQDGPLEWEEHVDWFHSRNESRHDFVIRYERRRVGVVSLDSSDEVGIFIGDFAARGQGIATVALRWLCERFRERAPLQAEIHVQNDPSKRLFERCGFDRSGQSDEWLRYVYDP